MSAAAIALAGVLAGASAAQLTALALDGSAGPAARAWLRRGARALRDQGLRERAGRLLRAASRLPGRRRAGRRAVRGACLDELPELLDVVALGLAAGISFDAALDIYCARYHTMLARRMGDAARCWRLGLKSRRQAMADLARELNVDAFTTFVATVGESVQLGAPLAESLIEQGEAVRERRRSEQQEAIEKAPVKMLIPVGTLTLPAMLLAILGPLFASFGAGP